MMASSSSFLPTEEVESESAAVPNWPELPKDITANILQRLDTFEIVTSACLVCPLWWNICKDPLMWRTIRMTDSYDSDYNLVDICRFAIERSCGHLENIFVKYFGTDELLQCIAESASKLRCLRFVNCWGITDKGFSEAVRKLPLLEGLDISLCNLSKDSLEVVGRSCTLLKMLMFVRNGFDGYDGESDDMAFVIAETMSGLCGLNISGNDITDVGLIAILDGCPLLETLIIRRCYNLDLSRSLRKRCHEQIKNLQLPIQHHREYDYDDHVTYLDSVLDDECYDPYD